MGLGVIEVLSNVLPKCSCSLSISTYRILQNVQKTLTQHKLLLARKVLPFLPFCASGIIMVALTMLLCEQMEGTSNK